MYVIGAGEDFGWHSSSMERILQTVPQSKRTRLDSVHVHILELNSLYSHWEWLFLFFFFKKRKLLIIPWTGNLWHYSVLVCVCVCVCVTVGISNPDLASCCPILWPNNLLETKNKPPLLPPWNSGDVSLIHLFFL